MEVKRFCAFCAKIAFSFDGVRYGHSQLSVAAHELLRLNRKPVVKHISWILVRLHVLKA
jgi:hypothetical protein